MDFPRPEPTDTDEVAWAIQTAHTSWKRGDVADAMRWLQRAAEAAEEAGDDRRLLTLARAATEFAQSAPQPGPPAAQAAPRELPRPPPPPSRSASAPPPSRPAPPPPSRPASPPLGRAASQPPRHHTAIGLGTPELHAAIAAAKLEQPRTPPTPPVSRSSSPPPLHRDSDPDFEQVTRVYDSGELRAATEDTRPTPLPPSRKATQMPALQTPRPAAGRASVPPAQTPTPPPARAAAQATQTSTAAARTPLAPAVTSRAPSQQTSAKPAASISPTPTRAVGSAERTQPRKPATHHALRVSVAHLPDPSMLTVRVLAEGERPAPGTREALLVPTHPDEDLY